jgi:hypothetical protein
MVMRITGYEIPSATPTTGAPACKRNVDDMRLRILPAGVPVKEPIISGIATAIITKYIIARDIFFMIIFPVSAVVPILYGNPQQIYINEDSLSFLIRTRENIEKYCQWNEK